ncbi:hypothetical protein THRCLA_02765 [Thraustotheca clavata]|uniref:Uncharacterized protein n=1 Tax=Thraustotheca clavata TaxID=74557 RepID=A0A1W0A484_9STRA|nr:hypothetical protein THRCLA_02765 [Thraustotheca clavata]
MEIWRNSVVRLLLLGTRDLSSPLHLLRGQDVVLKMILDHLIAIWKDALVFRVRGFVQFGDVEYTNEEFEGYEQLEFEPYYVQFPPPLMENVDGIMQCKPYHVNMMPFFIGDLNSLPKECRRYDQILRECFWRCGETGKVGYLTIHEGFVQANTSQRRPGLHVEAPNANKMKKRFRRSGFSEHKWVQFNWGEGRCMEHDLIGGIYMASNISDSCGIWNCVVKGKSNIVGDLGDVDVLHGVLNHNEHEYYQPGANELIWITDHTPHESLPLSTTQFRQYFRFVTSNVSVWFADHSTPNPLGIEPNAKIIYGSKFDSSLSYNP